jgi:hypothetical protein
MKRLLRHRPSSGLVVAIVAVVLASTGSAIAASQITSKQIKNGTIQLADISKSARKSLEGGRGPEGAPGAPGPAGAPGAPGATKVVVRQGTVVSVTNGTDGTATASCAPGERATGGGNSIAGSTWSVMESFPTGGNSTTPPTGWRVDAHNGAGTAQNLVALVICSSP